MNIISLNADDAYILTPSDTVPLPQEAVSLYVKTGGTLVVITAAEYFRKKKRDSTAALSTMTSVDLGTVVAGTVIPLRVGAVKSTGTTAVCAALVAEG